jgi:hypothetical protein
MAVPDDDRLLAYLLGELDAKEVSTLERSLRGNIGALAALLTLRQALEFSPRATPDLAQSLPSPPRRVALGSATILLRPDTVLFTFIPPTELVAPASEVTRGDEIEAMLSTRLHRDTLDSFAESSALREPDRGALRSEIENLSAATERIERALRGIKDPSLLKALPAARSALRQLQQFVERGRDHPEDRMPSGGRLPAYLTGRIAEEPARHEPVKITTRLAVPAGTERLHITGEPGQEPSLKVRVTGHDDKPLSGTDLTLVRPGHGFQDAETDLDGRASFRLLPGPAVLQVQGSQVRELKLLVEAD